MEEWRVQFIEHFPEIRQLPQIFFDGQRVGGLSGLQAALKHLEMR
jgi:glutaredoxin